MFAATFGPKYRYPCKCTRQCQGCLESIIHDEKLMGQKRVSLLADLLILDLY